MRYRFYTLLVLSLLFFACKDKNANNNSSSENDSTSVNAVSHSKIIKYGVDVTDLIESENTISPGHSLSNILLSSGADANSINNLNLVPDSILDPRKINAGNKYTIYNVNDSAHTLRYFVYHKSKQDFVVLEFLEDTIIASIFSKPAISKKRVSGAVITSSLWNAISDSELDINLALKLSDIYAWSIDFFGLQKMDSFIVYYSELYIDNEPIGIDSIYSAIFYHANHPYYAIYFEKENIKGYWDLEGNSLRKAFLKAPLSFSRISSHFTYARKHPIYKTVRPHTGVDYAAPAGTPVMSIGDGVVIAKGYKGGGGNTIKIRHNSVYTTAYLHLSKFASNIKEGTHVSQGQVIGYVGSTGSSTGPHLDFRVWKNGEPINPLKLESPPVEPIPDNLKAEFDSIKIPLIEILK
ncbi:MAG: peptidoglycan DD-metalloendopeptidase family protein [Paludibacteraceae bacterium]|nr:peptidoglycan DD-metalloendopeptidase family protein [Paludibacteraceae bacterium]